MPQYIADLEDLMKNIDFQKNEVFKVDMIFKILSSVNKLHKQNICHFDLKEKNIFLMNPFTPVIGDLGMVQTPEYAEKN